MRISDWSSDVCSSDLANAGLASSTQRLRAVLARAGLIKPTQPTSTFRGSGFSRELFVRKPGGKSSRLKPLPQGGREAPKGCWRPQSSPTSPFHTSGLAAIQTPTILLQRSSPKAHTLHPFSPPHPDP